jgi:hypothetical protein
VKWCSPAIDQQVCGATRTDCLCEPPGRLVRVCCPATLNAVPREAVVSLTRNARERRTGTAATLVTVRAVIAARAAEKMPSADRANFACAPIRLGPAWPRLVPRRAACPPQSVQLTMTAVSIVPSRALRKLSPPPAPFEAAPKFRKRLPSRISHPRRSRWLGRRPHNRGVTMNPVDHPMGGGEGRTSGGGHPALPGARVRAVSLHDRGVGSHGSPSTTRFAPRSLNACSGSAQQFIK